MEETSLCIYSLLHHHLIHTSRPGKIIRGNQQVTLLGDPRRVAKPGTDDVQRELALEFRLPAGPPLSKFTEWNNRGQPEIRPKQPITPQNS
jgi:hypothetical protein